MTFDLEKSVQVLERTPLALQALLTGIAPEWYLNNEGGDSWSPYDVLGHLINGEKYDWIPRMELILSPSRDKNFEPFDRFSQCTEKKDKTMDALIVEFGRLRKENLKKLMARDLGTTDLEKEGIHPEFGPVTIKQLLSTWTVHDLNHISQISRVMAKLYQAEVGPWKNYLGILK